MSVTVMDAVWKHSEARLGERLVLLAIAWHVQEGHREGWPSVATIAAETKVTSRGVRYAIRRLVQRGELEVRRRDGHSNLFHIPPVADWRRGAEAGFRGEDLSGVKLASGGAEAGFTPGAEAGFTQNRKLNRKGTVRESARTTRARPRGWHRVPPSESLTPERLEMGRKEGLLPTEIRRCWAAFMDHEFTHRRHDVDATWRNWLRKEVAWLRRAAPQPAPDKRAPVPAAVEGLLGGIGRSMPALRDWEGEVVPAAEVASVAPGARPIDGTRRAVPDAAATRRMLNGIGR